MPSVPWRVESSKIFLKIKKFPKFQKCPESFSKVSKRVLNLLWVKFFEKFFCPVFRGGSSFRKFSNKIFSKSKMPKSVPKSIQTCFEHVLGKIFLKNFMPSVPWRVEFSKIFKKNIFKIPNCPKVFPKVSKRVLNMFWGKFFEKFYVQCSMEGRVFENFLKNQKVFKIPKMPKIVPKSIQTCFEHVLGHFFRKNFMPSVPWRVESSKIFKKIKRNCKIPKMPKNVPKSIQTCFELVLGQTFRKFFCPVFHGRSRLRKFSKQSKNLQNSKSAPNRSKKYPNVF